MKYEINTLLYVLHHGMETKIANKYIISENIGGGCFGTIYRATNVRTNIQVAIKMEPTHSDMKLLKNETSILKYLYDQGSRDIPIVYWFGRHAECSCLVMSLYDCSLYDYIQKKSMTLTKINSIMISLINILSFVHTKLVIHRDIKPQNIMLKNGELFLIDFGFATFYVDENSNHLIDEEDREHIIGTPRYVSFHVHCGSLPSRRDDLISLGYMYIFLHNHSLPWDTIHNQEVHNSEYEDTHILNYKNKHRANLKRLDYILPLCNSINDEIENYIKYCYTILYNDPPLYASLIDIFTEEV